MHQPHARVALLMQRSASRIVHPHAFTNACAVPIATAPVAELFDARGRSKQHRDEAQEPRVREEVEDAEACNRAQSRTDASHVRPRGGRMALTNVLIHVASLELKGLKQLPLRLQTNLTDKKQPHEHRRRVSPKKRPTSRQRAMTYPNSCTCSDVGSAAMPIEAAAERAATMVSRQNCTLNTVTMTIKYRRPTAARPLRRCRPTSDPACPNMGMKPRAKASASMPRMGQRGIMSRMDRRRQRLSRSNWYCILHTLQLRASRGREGAKDHSTKMLCTASVLPPNNNRQITMHMDVTLDVTQRYLHTCRRLRCWSPATASGIPGGQCRGTGRA